MSEPSHVDAPRARAKRRWLPALAIGLLLVLLGTWLALRLLAQPDRVARFVLARAGAALGLEITAAGGAEYRLLGTPQLVVRDVTAREPGARAAVLHADRILLSVPWATLRARGASLDVQRLEIDAPRIDLAALVAWQSHRPPSRTRLPGFERGVSVRDGRVDGNGWRIDGIAIDLPRLQPGAPVRARLRARYTDGTNTASFDGALAMTRPDNGAGTALVGDVAATRADLRIASHLDVSAPLRIGDGLRLQPLRVALGGEFVRGATRQPFALGAYGPLSWRGSVLRWSPLGLATRERGAVPALRASGALAFDRSMQLQLHGTLPRWPADWPALPPPIGQSPSPLPFALAYDGASDFTDPLTLDLQRDATRFHGRARIGALLAWSTAGAAQDSPLPPLEGTLSTPSVEVSGATLEGVEVEMDDDGAAP